MNDELITHYKRNPNISLSQQIHTIDGVMAVNKEHINKAAASLHHHVFGDGNYNRGFVGVNDSHGQLFLYIFEDTYYKREMIPEVWETYPVEFHPNTGRPIAH